MKLIFSLLIIIIGLGNTNSFSQVVSDSSEVEKAYFLIVKNDGSEYYGYILKDDGREILLQTKSIGKIYINKSDIKEIRKVEESEQGGVSKNGEYSDLRESGPFTTRYYFTTNAMPLKKKENYALTHLYGPEVHFAVTDNLSLGVMATWAASPIAIAAKYSFTNPNPESDVFFAVGAIVGSGGYIWPEAFGGLYFATVTKGDRSSNVSFSLGFAHINVGGDLSDNYYYEKYDYQSHTPTQEYYVPNEFDWIYGEGNTNSLKKPSSNNGSVVLGISGIKSIGKKVSFIFDSMIFFTKRRSVVYDKSVSKTFSNTDYSTPYPYTVTTQDFTVGEGRFFDDGYKPTIILMPGMRFSRKYGSAFQVVLSGVIYERQNSRRLGGFPLPMVSWLKAF